MNIQIFGTKKGFDTRAAERFFKERKIKYQFIDLKEKGMSMKEIEAVIACVKDVDLLFDSQSARYEELNVAYILRTPQYKKELLEKYPDLIKTPIVRDCETRKATVGKAEAEWKTWIK